jgi:hypothetical protein
VSGEPTSSEFVINQVTFYLAFLITLGSAGAIIAQVVRGINSKIKRNREEAEARVKAADDAVRQFVEDKMKEVNEAKARVDYMYWKMVDKFFDEKMRYDNKQGG